MRTFLLPAVAAFLLSFAAPASSAPVAERVVVLISVDGLAHYYFDDPKAEMPTIRKLAAQGARAKMMKASMPTVTWPNHTTLVTGVQPGKHGVIGNNYFDREKGTPIPLIPDPIFNKDEIVKVPTVYDVAKEAGLKTAAICWPASRGAKTLDWTVPDVFKNELFQGYATPALLTEWKAAGIPYEKQEEWCKGNQGRDRDLMYVKMLTHVLGAHRPNLALLHLVELDHVEHWKGPQSSIAYEVLKFEDDRVKEVWDALQKDFPGRATLIVTADHGFFPYQQTIQANVLLRKEGLLTTEGTKITGGAARALSQGGSSFIYIHDTAHLEEIRQKLVTAFKNTEGVALVLTPAEYGIYGLADPTQDRRMADLVVSCKSGYSFADSLTGDLVITPKDETKGTHGYDPKEPGMHAEFVAWGVGIQPGTQLGLIENTSVAPTVAALLGLEMKQTDGPVLKDILAPLQH